MSAGYGGNVSTVNVGVVGVGHCASSLVQGVEYYSNTAAGPAGLTNALCAGYAVSDVRFTSALDVNVSKIAFIRLEGTAFGGTPLELELRMCVEESPSAAGNVLDAVRYMKFAMDRGIAGVVDPVSSLLMKATPRPMSEPAALAELSPMIDQPRTSRRHRGLRTGHDRSPQET